MIDSQSIALVGKPAYYWSYLAPIAREFYRRFEQPVTAVTLDGAFPSDRCFTQPGRLRPCRRVNVAIAFDVWSMIAAWACARTVIYVHHSLVGKGLVFRGNEPFRPFAFADMLCLPIVDRQYDMPARMRDKIRITGHPPFDWLHAEAPLPDWQDMLRAWGDEGNRIRVAVLCTQGEFGSVHLLDEIARARPDGVEFGVKLHGYLKRRDLPPGMRALGDCPTALIVQHSDLVVTDHSTAAVEAHTLNVPCICYRSQALMQLQNRYPSLSELHYLKGTKTYGTVPELAMLMRDFSIRRATANHVPREGGVSASARILDLCTKL